MDTYEMEPMRVRQRDTHEVATMRQCLTYRTHETYTCVSDKSDTQGSGNYMCI